LGVAVFEMEVEGRIEEWERLLTILKQAVKDRASAEG
jgi:hypothetical protein